jgi:hypothetical protein
MLMTRAIALGVECGARGCSPLRNDLAVRHSLAACSPRRDTLVRGSSQSGFSARDTGGADARLQNSARFSPSIADCGRRGRLIREKIIGHGLRGFAGSVAVYRRFLHHRVLALAHQPARQQSRCVLLQPGIEQLRDLLTQIGGMVQAREFVALQGIAGSGEQELPGGLSFVIQGVLREERRKAISSSQKGNGTKYVRSVEKCAKFSLELRASTSFRSERRAQR